MEINDDYRERIARESDNYQDSEEDDWIEEDDEEDDYDIADIFQTGESDG